MKKVLSISFWLWFAWSIHAQVSSDYIGNSGMQILTTKNTPQGFTGSPYAEEDFQAGVIYDKNKDKSQPALLRYNAVEDVIEIRFKRKDKSNVLPKFTHIVYKMDNYTYFIDNINTENGNIEAYFARFYDGENLKFIARPVADVTPAAVARTGYGKDKPANLDVEMEYYITTNGDFYKEVRLKEKDFEEIFTSDAMKDYFDDHKIKTEMDVVKMLEFHKKNNS